MANLVTGDSIAEDNPPDLRIETFEPANQPDLNLAEIVPVPRPETIHSVKDLSIFCAASDVESAVYDIERLLANGADPNIQHELCQALRASDPIHFKFPEVRAIVLDALSNLEAEVSRVGIFVEEMELHPGEPSCDVACRAIERKWNELSDNLKDRVLIIAVLYEGGYASQIQYGPLFNNKESNIGAFVDHELRDLGVRAADGTRTNTLDPHSATDVVSTIILRMAKRPSDATRAQ